MWRSGTGVQDLRIEFADHKAKVQVAVDDRRDVFATNFTAITFVALGHVRVERDYDSPNTSNMLYSPLSFPCSHFAAANAPEA